ncbi:hypothetical protein Pla163_28820 [Planctomycetes bacterium Pla163]|uniref:PsbP C-terminal domain-containing protein n=1 Tax=Rohdeia mirabilis TaxID=2528008 RepID=A0A518D2P9_9BACT|nr:hypothetical protein Pla163_28820 [Planctomycetes bacterium Pla163]
MLRPIHALTAIALCSVLVACDDTTAAEGPRAGAATSGAAPASAALVGGRDWFAPSGERTEFASVGLSIERPAGFVSEPAQGYAVLSAPEHGASIALARLSQPYSVALRGYDAAGMAQRGTAIDASEDVEIAGLKGLLSTGTTSANGLELRRVLLLLGDDTRSWLVTANAPVELWESCGEGLIAAVRSVRPVVPNGPAPPR